MANQKQNGNVPLVGEAFNAKSRSSKDICLMYSGKANMRTSYQKTTNCDLKHMNNDNQEFLTKLDQELFDPVSN